MYILGDLFEAWIGDDDDAPLAGEVSTLLRTFSATGTELCLMRGNRDFLIGDVFCESIGATLLPDPTVVDLYGTPTLLMHGDSLCTDDVDYQAFRLQMQDPKSRADLLALSIVERREIANHLRSMSGQANSNKAQDIMDVTDMEVNRVLREHRVERLIHGHTHRPAEHKLALGTRWVLGDWETKGWAIKADSEGIDLYNFDI